MIETNSNKNILLVDDEPELREVCKEALTDAGYTVFTAGNGAMALDFLDSTTVDLVISDMNMPKLDGLSMLKGINQRKLDADIIFLTGYGTVENAVECLKMGASEYLLKPFDLIQLLTKVGKILRERDIKSNRMMVNDLHKILDLSRDLNEDTDEKTLLKQFLKHIKQTFKPDSLVFYSGGENGSLTRDGLTPLFAWGDFFKPGTKCRSWFRDYALHLVDKRQPKLLDPVVLGNNWTGNAQNLPFDPTTMSALVAPVSGFLGRNGAVALVRQNSAPFTMDELQLLNVFVSHAGFAVEYHNSCRQMKAINLEIISSYVQAVEAKDVYTKGHSENVSNYAIRLGKALSLHQLQLQNLKTAALLHDIGKIGIPDNILNKPSPLTGEELSVMRRHPEIGKDILAGVNSLQDVLPVIFHHHERFDGSGYPEGLKGEEIPLLARIIAVADGFEAMTSNRAYQRARSKEDALEILQMGAGTQWDPAIIKAWVQIA